MGGAAAKLPDQDLGIWTENCCWSGAGLVTSPAALNWSSACLSCYRCQLSTRGQQQGQEQGQKQDQDQEQGPEQEQGQEQGQEPGGHRPDRSPPYGAWPHQPGEFTTNNKGEGTASARAAPPLPTQFTL